ncbi:hypothetical protein [Nostoc sp. CHAB 5715]|uniref:hypothetical protein n=1 Tax=Nostoc sp. CHAB 5715 TaxID=2780400 RepID=UPI001E5EFB48|nr:hypothetical protein [Nostoc sp. CHAB 5715]MCC5625264.1 hypothetical protein [Nostoc sp. CHAB 5715]
MVLFAQDSEELAMSVECHSRTPTVSGASCWHSLWYRRERKKRRASMPPLDMLLIASVSLNKPVVRYSLFVMNTDAAII